MAYQEVYLDENLSRRIPSINICFHCRTDCGKNKFCEQCTTKEKRQEMCKLNAEILPTYFPCKLCRS